MSLAKDLVITPMPPGAAAGKGSRVARGEGAFLIRAKNAEALEVAVKMTAQFYEAELRKEKLKKNPFSAKEALSAISAPSNAEVFQLRRNAEARTAFLTELTTLTSKEVAELAGSRAKNQAALANRWKAEGRIFAVETGGQTLFPAFQLDENDGQPRPVVAEILAALGPEGSGWQTALWFTSRNGWLGGQRPVDLLGTDPNAVAQAARREAEAFD